MSPNPKEPVPALRPHEIGAPSYRNKLDPESPRIGSIGPERTQEPHPDSRVPPGPKKSK